MIWSIYLYLRNLQRQLSEKKIPSECEFPCMEDLSFYGAKLGHSHKQGEGEYSGRILNVNVDILKVLSFH